MYIPTKSALCVRKSASILCLGLLLLTCIEISSLQNQCNAAPSEKQDIKAKKIDGSENVSDRDLAQLTLKVNELALSNLDMQKELRAIDTVESIGLLTNKFSASRQSLEEKFQELKTDPSRNFRRLVKLRVELEKTGLKVKQATLSVADTIARVDKWIDYWQVEEADIQDWEKGLGPSTDLASVQNFLQQYQLVIQQARDSLDIYLQPLLKVQEEAGALQLSFHNLGLEIGTLLGDTLNVTNNTAWFFSPSFFSQFDANLLKITVDNATATFKPDFAYLQPYKLAIALSIVLYLFILSALKRVSQTLSQTPKVKHIVERRYSLALFVSLLNLSIFAIDIGELWQFLFHAISLICLWRLNKSFISDTRLRVAVNMLIILMILAGASALSVTPLIIERVLVVVGSLFLLAIIAYGYRPGKSHEGQNRWKTLIYRILIAVLILSIFAEVTGRPTISFYLFSSLLKTLFLLIVVWGALVCLSIILEVFLDYSRSSFLRTNAKQINNLCRPLLNISACFILALSILVGWGAYPSVPTAFESLTNLGITIGGSRVSIGSAGSALFFLYLVFSFSKLIEIMLLNTILPRRNIQRGVQLSIARLSNYSIWLFGVFSALLILGFNLTNLTLLGGAVGVGIGFGLQTIFNNFVSGLILLFERPIKVGDVIMVGTEFGEVKKLGLRSTVVQTYDNSEIVVPNSSLITSNVTNWTLDKRHVRVKVPFGIAYGSDIDRVLEIMTTCANENPRVLSNPEPAALFITHGPSSLDFELRVFIPDIDDKMAVRSELNQAINSALEEAGITIPFPQRDLHLKTVSEDVMAAMSIK